MGRLDDSLNTCRQALRTLERVDNPIYEGSALHNIGSARRRFPEAVDCLGRCLVVFEDLVDLHGQVEALVELARTWQDCGHLAGARRCLVSALERIVVRLLGAGPVATADHIRGLLAASMT